MTSLLLFAQEPAPAAPNFFSFGGPGFMFAMLALVFVFFVILPGRRQRKEQEQMIANIKAGSKVILSSGVVATVTKVHDDGELTVRSDESKLRVLRSAVVSVRGEEPGESK